MSDLPDFSSQGYEVIAEMERDAASGWVTYLAKQQLRPDQARSLGFDPKKGKAATPGKSVIIKEFRLQSGTVGWDEFQTYERERQLLQELDHPGIPRYLDAFETSQGFCLVQQDKNAIPLTERTSFTPAEIKSLTRQLLRVLAYLHSRIPPILHRDIRPETIWIERQARGGSPDERQVFLMDFRLAGTGTEEIPLGSSGITAPEQLQGQPFTPASDLYALGATLICLLTGTPSNQLPNLLNQQHEFELDRVTGTIDSAFGRWLEKLVDPDPKKRYPNARTALEALEPLTVRADREQSQGRTAVNLPVIVTVGAIAGLLGLMGAGAIAWLTIRQSPVRPIAVEVPASPMIVSSSSDRTLEQQGDRFLEEKRYEEAVEAYTRATEVNPRNGDAWFGLGLSLIRLKRYQEALSPCVKATELKPTSSAAWYNRGLVLAKLERPLEAVAMYDKSLQVDPQDAMTWLNKGFALYEAERKQEAIAAYDQALKLKPDYGLAWNNRCLVLNDWQRYQEALPDCEKATQYDPELHYGWNNKGEALYHLGRYQEALVAFNKALELKPDYGYAIENRRRTLKKLQP